MNDQDKTKEELIKELQELQQENNSLKALYDKDITDRKQAKQKLIIANKELLFQNEEKEKRAAELIIANKELKKTEQAIKETEEKYRTIIQTSLYGFYLVNMQGRLLEVNETYCRMSGYSSLELLTMSISDLEAVETPVHTAAHIQKIKSLGEDRFETRHRRKDGSIFDIEASVQYQLIESGRFVVFMQDISERKRTEETLIKLEKAIYNSGEAIFLTDREGVFTFVNPAFTLLYGFSSDELVGKTTPRIITSGVLDKSIYKVFWQTLLNGDEVRWELINKRKDGTLINIDSSATPIIDEEKKIIGFLGIQRNITERKRAEEELAEKEFFLRESQRAGNIGSFKTNFVTGYWQSSETLDRILGIDKNYDRSIAGWLEIIHPDDRQKMDEDLRLEVIGKRKSFNKEYRILRINDNQTRWVCGFGDVKFDDSGNITEMIGTIQDITGQKKAEQELRDRKSMLKEAQKIAHLGSWDLNFATNVALWSDEACRIYGLSPKENKQTYANWVSFIHPEDLDYVMTATNKSQKTLNDTVLNHRIILKDGTIKHIYSVARFKFDQNGKPVGLYGIAHDVTKRKEAEIDLKASEERFRTLIQNNTDAIMVLNKNGKVIFSSDSLYRIMGYNADEIIGVNTFNFIYSEDLPALKKHLKKVLKNPGKSIDITYRRVKKDGTIIWCEGTALNLLHDPAIQGIVINFRNITERKEAEEQIRQSEARLTEAQRLAKMGSWNYDIKADRLTWSEELYHVFDTDKQTFIETHGSFLHLIDEKDREFALQTSRLTQKTGEPFTIEYHITTSKGEKRVILEHGYGQKDDNGKIIRLFGTAQDITEKVLSQIEKEKIIADIVQRNKDLEQFTYIVSHNLRAPVANILGATSLLSNPELSTKEKDVLNRGLNESVAKLDSVVKDLNQILQIKSKINEIKEEVSFSDLVEDIKISIQDLTGNDRIKIKYDFFEIDNFLTLKSYFYSIFYNLISNSLKYRQPDIPLVIEIKSRKLKDKMELIFKDNGRGMDLEKAGDKVFGLYKRFHSEGIEGKGMGLYMVKTQVESLGGKISISSKVNQGTEFKIEFEI